MQGKSGSSIPPNIRATNYCQLEESDDRPINEGGEKSFSQEKSGIPCYDALLTMIIS